MHIINVDAWIGPPSGGYHTYEGITRTFKEVYFTFLPLHTALTLLKEQERLFIRYHKNQGHTWSVTGITTVPWDRSEVNIYHYWVNEMRQCMSDLQAMEITADFNNDWLSRNQEYVNGHYSKI